MNSEMQAPVQAQEQKFKEVGSFLYVGAEYVATSSDDPRGIKLYRPTAAPVQPMATPIDHLQDALEQAANLAIKFTAVPRDYLGPATQAMKLKAELGEKLATAIRALHVKAVPAAAPQVAVDERAAFEAAARRITHSDDSSFGREGDDYADYTQSRHWAFWQARAALTAAPVQPMAMPAQLPSPDLWVYMDALRMQRYHFGFKPETHPNASGYYSERIIKQILTALVAQGNAIHTSDKALLDFMDMDHRLHISTTYVGLSYVPTFEVAKMTGYIGNDQLTYISSGKTLREALAAAIAASKAVKS
jgi:hypothetical protein